MERLFPYIAKVYVSDSKSCSRRTFGHIYARSRSFCLVHFNKRESYHHHDYILCPSHPLCVWPPQNCIPNMPLPNQASLGILLRASQRTTQDRRSREHNCSIHCIHPPTNFMEDSHLNSRVDKVNPSSKHDFASRYNGNHARPQWRLIT